MWRALNGNWFTRFYAYTFHIIIFPCALRKCVYPAAVADAAAAAAVATLHCVSCCQLGCRLFSEDRNSERIGRTLALVLLSLVFVLVFPPHGVVFLYTFEKLCRFLWNIAGRTYERTLIVSNITITVIYVV